MRRKPGRWATAALVLLAAAWSGAAGAGDSQEWALSSVEDFLPGEFDGVILESPGTLRVGLARVETPVEASQVWCVAQDSRGRLYLGTGNEALLYVLDKTGEELYAIELDGSQVYALAIDAHDTVYAASAPTGAIYKITPDGEAEEWYRPEATYTWALLAGSDGALYAATGDPGTIVRITGPGKATVIYTSEETHLLSLAEGPDASLCVGTGNSGLLLSVTPRTAAATGRVVYDTPLEEIRSIVPAADGRVYFVAVQSEPGSAVPTAALKLTGVGNEAAGANGGEGAKAAAAPPTIRPGGAAASVVYRLGADGTSEPHWTAQGQRVYSAALVGEDLMLGTDQEGTLFRVSRDGIPAVVYRGRAEKLIATATAADGTLLLGTAEAASVVRLGPGAPAQATYTSAAQDAATLAQYGRVRWGIGPDGRGPAVSVRTGNTREPAAAWSAWSAPSRKESGVTFDAPPGRYLQFRVQWSGPKEAALTRMHVAFAPRNLAPRVTGITVEQKGRVASAGVNAGAEADAAVLQNLLKKYNGGDAASKAAEEEAHTSDAKVTWTVLDPNGDRLEYAVHFRGVDETLWKELETELEKAEYTWDTSLVPDGWYELRVTASDEPSNAADAAAVGERVSEAVLVDNTGPTLGKLTAARGRTAGTMRISGRAEDSFLPLRRGRYALDGEPWKWFAPEDGIFDSETEAFVLDFTDLAAGEHTVAVQVLDAALNIGSAKQVFRVE